jgi:hypothetical protein
MIGAAFLCTNHSSAKLREELGKLGLKTRLPRYDFRIVHNPPGTHENLSRLVPCPSIGTNPT